MNCDSFSDESGVLDLISSFLGSAAASQKSTLESVPAENVNESTTSKEDAASKYILDPNFVPPVRVVVFSKDRPWQLQQLLRSMELPITHRHSKSNLRLPMVDIFIIINASSGEFETAYKNVMQSIICNHECNCSGAWRLHFLFEDEVNVASKGTNSGSRYSNSFSRLLKSAVTDVHDHGLQKCDVPTSLQIDVRSNIDDVIMFLTDDCLLLEPLEAILVCAIGSLAYRGSNSSSSRVFNFASRLHLGVSWSQTRNVPSPPPRNKFKFHSLSSSVGVYLYKQESASVEWNYQFDLSGGVYYRSDVITLMNNIADDGLSHPNLFELRCNEALKSNPSSNQLLKDLSQKALSAIPTRPFLVILTVNRVQDVFSTPLASPSLAPPDGEVERTIDPSNTTDLLNLINSKTNLDVERYKTTLYNTSHIGDFFLQSETSDRMVSAETKGSIVPKLSVLIPVHTVPAEFASHAIVSIIMQPFYQDDGSLILNNHGVTDLMPMQIVLIDDRCTDGSIQAMVDTAETLAALLQASLRVQDFRCDSKAKKSFHPSSDDEIVVITIDIVSTPNPGVASALNHGLKYCQSELVARMDADDVSAPNRLLTQLHFMRANPSCNVVGTSTVLFSSGKSEQVGKEDVSTCVPPYYNTCLQLGVGNAETYSYAIGTSLCLSDPGFMAWSMLFSCSIPHPSVMFRKSVIKKISGYDEAVSRCEDYELWLRMTCNDCRSMATLPMLGLFHRKHTQSKSVVESAHQKEQANMVCFKAIKSLLESACQDLDAVTLESVSTVRNPSDAQSPRCVDAAASLLQRIERAFIQVNSKYLTCEEVRLIHLDTDYRIAELASKFLNKSHAWKIWCQRCPEQQLERLSLLCNSNQ